MNSEHTEDTEHTDHTEEFNSIYEDLFQPQVIIGNIPHRKYEDRCRCHPNINNEIINSNMLKSLVFYNCSNINVSISVNKPKIFDIPQSQRNKIYWIIDELSEIFDDVLEGHYCMDDINVIHRMFWNSFNNKDREYIRDLLDDEFSWSNFSFLMCALFKKSFDHNEIN
jgi:hypothetical protein